MPSFPRRVGSEAPAVEPQTLELAPLTEAPAEPEDEFSGEFAALEEAPSELLLSDDNWSLGEVELDAAPLEETIDFGLVTLSSSVEELPAFDFDELEPFDSPDQAAIDSPLESLSLESLEDAPVSWDAAEFAMELPEVELPSALIEPVAVPAADKPLSMADVMAAPVQAINPPAQDVPPSLLPPPADEEPIDEELLEVFVEEVGEVLETISDYLPRWCADTTDKDALAEIRRAFHTLKGSGRMVRALVIGELGWSIENLLNRVLDRSIQPDEPVQQVVKDVVALMPALVEEFANKAQRQRDDVDLLAATAHALARGLPPPMAAAATVAAEPMLAEETVEPAADELDEPSIRNCWRSSATRRRPIWMPWSASSPTARRNCRNR